ncbi:MAG TPA: redoxin domain-containing protein [bacterium]|nr:redoxin domain-containing protein [bacterium]HPS28688.1 redoxin domain-containing protein [bacterium]
MNEMNLKPGAAAPDFCIPDQFGVNTKLSELKCKNVLLSFHPLAFTGVCKIQMETLELKKKVFDELNTVALGISVDSQYTKKAWAESIGVKETKLLADFWPHGEVARLYEQFIEKAGVSGRANILIDENGKIKWIRRYEIPEVPDIEEVFKMIRG